jgi:hypothetical protein
VTLAFGTPTFPASLTVAWRLIAKAVLMAALWGVPAVAIICVATWITVTMSEPAAAVPKFMWTVSPPPNALPVFITLVGEFAGMFAMILIAGKLLPPAIASVLVQLAVCVPIPLQIQEAAVVEKLFTV